MANTFKLKTSNVQGKSPSVSDLQLSELAWNSYDGKLYGRKNNGTDSIVEIGAGGGGGGGGISTLNTLTDSTQTFAAGTSGTDFAISSSSGTHTFNIPSASTTARGLVTTTAQSFTDTKTFTASTATNTPLVAKGAASQTADLLQVQNSAGTNLLAVDKDGNIGGLAAASVPLKIKGAVSQSGDYVSVSEGGGAVVARVVPQSYGVHRGSYLALRAAANGTNYLVLGTPANSAYGLFMGIGVGGEAFSTFVGAGAGNKFTGATSGYNVAVGTNAMVGSNGCYSQECSAVGYRSGLALLSGNQNAFFGASSGEKVTSGRNNAFFGAYTGYNITTGSYNASLNGGMPAGAATASYMIAIGSGSLANGSNAVAIGRTASANENCFSLSFGNATRMTGDANGQFGVNEVTPGGQLQVTTGAADRKAVIVKAAASQSANLVEVQNSSATNLFAIDKDGCVSGLAASAVPLKVKAAASQTASLAEFQNSSGTVQTLFNATGKLTIGASAAGSEHLVVQSGGANSVPASFYPDAASSNSTEAIRIYKYDNDSTSDNTFVRFYINAGSSAAGSGRICANGGGFVQFGTFSDIALKENVVDLPPQLGLIRQMKPREWDWKDGSGHQIGFVAQEVEGVYPDLVGQDGQYKTLVGLQKNEARLIKCIQELANKIDSLEVRILALET